MDLEKQLRIIEEQGNDHLGSSIETPLRSDAFELSDIEKIALIKKDVQNIMTTLGLDLTDDSLKGTPTRVAKMFVQEIFGGLRPDKKPKASTFKNSYKYSKMNRVVDYFAKRPQVQERLTRQIVAELQHVLGTEDVACVIDAKHLCVNSRGIKDIDSSTVTSEFGGKFKTPQIRREFLDYIKLDTEF